MSCKKKTKTTQDKQEERNTQVELECVLLALLSLKYSFTISKPQKKAENTKLFIKVKSVKKNNDTFVFDLQQFVKLQTSQIYHSMTESGIKQKTAFRRTQSNKRSQVVHFFEDLLFEEGFLVMYKKFNREGVVGDLNIYYNQRIMLNKIQIRQIGNTVWSYLMEKQKRTNTFEIKNEELLPFLYGNMEPQL
ncbi:hypothetical protein EIN_080980 [Entamoeba invadens IP1]|uniref:hypothetical protein n=1 Tax=Entamoeba invadens IP1 TaxID=370355 RepID=UPI0002C3DD35|nr:hypothetical protein EIN_080980 [Entamoeba invadens IP1]ELP85126.1 hypothetical protein EIN_080980 [Entamoeba invadens IP1]|eukprot:XP_004184472.1 hypothetical protein EIN_080980 [Entamoeba invadens IP1]